ncbi:MarR family winged helix-turn-helix transcriptional regulator, partial [Rhodopseudomonas sp. B29]|uniref:MarR family winged helix-turn-helix transcriptional regulator n=1 Tax=Rhodopseudomonas sp. B29 TaxID=95607 RepID=UPI0003B6BC99
MSERPAGKRARVSASGAQSAPEDGELVIDFDRYVPTVLSSLVAKFRANSNGFFLKTYGVSLGEWRILSFLREHGPASAYDVWTRANLDKALVSRESASLIGKGLVELTSVSGSGRKRSEISLTAAGIEMLDRSIDEILRRHDNLTAGLDAETLRVFFGVIAHLERRIPHMGDDTGDRSRSLHAPVKRVDKRR